MADTPTKGASGTLIEFQADLAAFAQAVNVTMEQAVRRVTLEIHNGCIEKTPVDTGRARSSWGISLDQPGDYLPPPGEYGPGGAASLAQQRELEQLEGNPYREVWVFSNLPYIEALELGHSQQSPQGMAAVTLAEVAVGIDAMLAEVTKQYLPNE